MSQTATVDPREAQSLDEVPVRRATGKRRWLFLGLGLLAVVAVLGGIKAAQIVAMIRAGEQAVMPPESVSTAKAEQTEWQGGLTAVGSVLALRAVTLSSEVPGAVRAIDFENGAAVKKDQVLVRLDASTDAAQLAGAEAEAELQKLNLARVRTLREQEANTPADLELAEARAAASAATVRNLRALVGKKVIRAPFDGRIGIRQVELGQVIAPGTAIASLQTVSPVYVEFSLPQQALAEAKVGQKLKVHVDTFPDESWDGELTTINPEVDLASRTVRMRATVPNPDARLTPGMFASVELLASEKQNTIVVPATSVIFAPYGDSLFVVEEAKDGAGKGQLTARQRFVRLGDRRGDFVAVLSGVKAGETVVSSGAFKLRNGSAVAVNNANAPKNELAPQPATP